MPNFLIVDDHTSVREGLRRLFEAEYPGSGIGFTATPSGCLNAMQEHSWDLIVLDISLPQRDGLSLIPEIKDISPNTQVLVHTMHGEEQFGQLPGIRLVGGDISLPEASHVPQVRAGTEHRASATQHDDAGRRLRGVLADGVEQ